MFAKRYHLYALDTRGHGRTPRGDRPFTNMILESHTRLIAECIPDGRLQKSLKSSSVTKVKVPKAAKKAYRKIFVKKVCGKKVRVK